MHVKMNKRRKEAWGKRNAKAAEQGMVREADRRQAGRDEKAEIYARRQRNVEVERRGCREAGR